MIAPVVIVGAGLAGLACARHLSAAGRAVLLCEQSDGVGGRVRTDTVDGFLLDRGFQVLLEAYPEARTHFDYARLGLVPFFPGALVRTEGAFHLVADPFRAPLHAVSGLFSPIGSLGDKLRVLALRRAAQRGSLEELFRRPETTTRDALARHGFSPTMISRFFEPFLGGIFLGRDLETSSRMLEFVFRMMADGDTCLPAHGMGSLSTQLADALPAGAVQLRRHVTAVAPDGVRLEDGTHLPASAVVVATEGDVAAHLTGAFPAPAFRSCATLYFDAPTAPLRGRKLILNGGLGLVNTLCVPSDLCPAYAPAGRALVSVTVLGTPSQDDAALTGAVRAELIAWYGAATVLSWRHLRTYRIRWAQPDQNPPALEPAERPVQLTPTLFVAGDHRDTASIHGALASGRRAAAAVLDASR